jgi:hypothetical protein
MKILHKAVILGIVTESLTVSWFVVARGQGGISTMLAILHAPGISLLSHGSPWLLAVLIETALWVLFWFLLLRLFATPRDEVTSGTFTGIHSERKSHE